MFTYLLGALCGLFREVVVGVVSLRDATKQHGHNACRTTYTHTHNLESPVKTPLTACVGLWQEAGITRENMQTERPRPHSSECFLYKRSMNNLL